MAKIRFDKLIDNYLPTNKDFYHPENTQELSGDTKDTHIFIDSKINIGDKETPYKEYKFITESTDENNQKVFYLSMYGTDTSEPLTIVEDYTASNAKALKVLSGYAAVFQTPYPYNPQTLKKLVVRVKAIEKGDLRIGITGISNKAIIKPDGSIGYPTTTTDIDFYEIISTTGTDIGYNYVTLIGYFKGTTAEPLTDNSPFDGNIQSFPSYNPNVPYALRDGTTDVALAFKCLSGQYYIDSIEIQDVEADITSIPGGTTVVETITGVELKAEPPIIQYSTRANLLTKEILLTAELSNLSGSAVFTTTEGILVDVVDEHENIVPNKKILKLDGDDTIVPPVLPVPYDNNTVNVTCTLDGYGATVSLYKSGGGISAAYNFGLVNNTGSIPRTTPEGEPLVDGDYFLWGGEHETIEDLALEGYVFLDDLFKGEIYEYSNDGWLISANGNLVMTMFDDIAVLLENNPDIDSQVMSNAVIGRLAVLEAFIQRLVAQDLEIANSGAIRQNYDKSGNIEDASLPGFYLGLGQLKANEAELIGSLRTGRDIPKGSRVGIKDRNGFVKPLEFVGTGVDDLIIFNEGREPGEYEIIVDKTDEYMLIEPSTGSPTFLGPMSTDAINWKHIASSGDVLIMVGENGYYSRSTDNGRTWSTPTQNGLYKWDYIATSGSAWIMTGSAYWSRSTDDGLTWSTPVALPVSYPNPFYSSPISVLGTTWVITHFGFWDSGGFSILYSYDDGESWSAEVKAGSVGLIVTTGQGTALESGKIILYDDVWFAIANYRLSYYMYRSTNNGASWTICPMPSNSSIVPYPRLDVLEIGSTYLALGVNYSLGKIIVLKSTNYGASWTSVIIGDNTYPSYLGPRMIIVGSYLVALILSEYMYSADSGASWSGPRKLSYVNDNFSGVVSNEGKLIGVSENGSVYTNEFISDAIKWRNLEGSYSEPFFLYPTRTMLVAEDTIIRFSNNTGHTVGDKWTFTKDELIGLSILDGQGREYVRAFDGKYYAKDFHYFSHEETATLTPATNLIEMENLVPALNLEIGDVIQIVGGGDNDGRLHTVEDIEDNDSIVVNYEHCGNRGNGSLKLFSYSGNLIIKLIAKWWQAPLGLGQDWVDVQPHRTLGGTNTNSTGRTIKGRMSKGGDYEIQIRVHGEWVAKSSATNQTDDLSVEIVKDAEYSYAGSNAFYILEMR